MGHDSLLRRPALGRERAAELLPLDADALHQLDGAGGARRRPGGHPSAALAPSGQPVSEIETAPRVTDAGGWWDTPFASSPPAVAYSGMLFAFAAGEGGNALHWDDFGVTGMKWLVSFLPLLTAFASVVPCAGAQSVGLPTSDDPVGDVVQTTEDALELTPSDDPVGDVVETTEDGFGDVSQPDAAGSGTASGPASPGKAFSTRFDRLPPRLERLLERIELGRNLRANLRRLEQVLASASARERARLLRLLNAEIRRLRADGVSATERRRIDRLVRAREALISQPAPMPSSAAEGATTGTSGAVLSPGTEPRFGHGVLGAFVAGNKAVPTDGATPPRGGAHPPSGPSGVPDEGGEETFALTKVLLALGLVLLVIVSGLAIKEERDLRLTR